MRLNKFARSGFTLIEAALTTCIIGIGAVSMLQLLAAGTSANQDSLQQTGATNLVRNVRELCLDVPFAQLPTYNNRTYSPPVDSRGQPITAMTGWTQRVTVQSVDPARLSTNIIDSTPDAVRVTVTITRNGQDVASSSWYAFGVTP
jgi:Tfp pilus assembly protein PilV